ncbi:hypothetical protein [Streptomyces sp. N35]|uniref:hypothetical protein n=1 Tax=Streptomyces sp. N35 TaxID=2795730 RepID=UPI0018F310E5|nr:hypothetical protein [Streptomyces sp. N35]
MNTTTPEPTVYVPVHWLGTRMAQQALNVSDPIAHLTDQHRKGTPLAPYVQITASAIHDLDRLDADAESFLNRLSTTAHSGRRYTDGPYSDADAALDTAHRLAQATHTRDQAATHLNRLLHAYRTATAPRPTDTPEETL